MSVFKSATSHAIREIIIEHSSPHRFGLSLTDDDLDSICTRVAELFEMTLQLRSQWASGYAAKNDEKNLSESDQNHLTYESSSASLQLPRRRLTNDGASSKNPKSPSLG